MAASSNIAIVLTFIVGVLLYLAKLRFLMKILAAKTQVNVFNHSLALCLFASGGERNILELVTFMESLISQVLALWFVFLLQSGFSMRREIMRKRLSKSGQCIYLNWDPFPLKISWNATALKNIQTLDNSTESNFQNDPLGKASGNTRILFRLQK